MLTFIRTFDGIQLRPNWALSSSSNSSTIVFQTNLCLDAIYFLFTIFFSFSFYKELDLLELFSLGDTGLKPNNYLFIPKSMGKFTSGK